MRKRPLLVVEWDDVSSYHGWKDTEEAKTLKPFRAKMVGWEISRDKDNLILVSGFSSDDDCNGQRIIPRGCIRKVRRLE